MTLPSERSLNFHRLATKRVETITDAIRIFSNLSGPSYEWTAEEVLSYITKIDQARNTALGLFQEQKRWKSSVTLSPGSQSPLPSSASATASFSEDDEPVPRSRIYTTNISEQIKAALSDPTIDQHTVALQRVVIEDLKQKLEEASS